MTSLEAARNKALLSETPYKSFHDLTGYHPGQFHFKRVQEVTILRTANSWSEVVRLKEILILQSLDLSHEPDEQRAVTQVPRESKPRREKFKLEDL